MSDMNNIPKGFLSILCTNPCMQFSLQGSHRSSHKIFVASASANISEDSRCLLSVQRVPNQNALGCE